MNKKAKITKSGKFVGGKLADIFVKVGVAKYVDEKVDEKPQEEIISEDNISEEIVSEEVVQKPIVNKKAKKRGRKPNKK